MPLSIISVLFLIGYALYSSQGYYGMTLFTPLKSPPSGSTILIDNEIMGNTSITVHMTYLHNPFGDHADETRLRTLRIEKSGYKPFESIFLVRGREFEKIQRPVILEQLAVSNKSPDSEKKEQAINAKHEVMKKEHGTALKKRDELSLKYDSLLKNYKGLLVEHEKLIALKDEKSVYTIQAGSFKTLDRARRQFNSMTQRLSNEARKDLRIEKIKDLFTVRVGSFDNYADAKKYLENIHAVLPSAYIIHAFIKGERIINSLSDKYVSEGKEGSRVTATPEKSPDDVKALSEITAGNDVMENDGKSDRILEIYKKALELGKSGRHKEAIKMFEQVLSEKSLHADVHYNIGVAYDKLGLYDQAIRWYLKTIKIKPEYSDAHFNLGVIYYKQKKFKEAISSFQNSLKTDPDNIDSHINIAISYGQYGNYDEAVRHLEKAVRLSPGNAEAHYNLGFAYLMRNDKESAMNEYNILKEIDTRYAKQLYNEIKQ